MEEFFDAAHLDVAATFDAQRIVKMFTLAALLKAELIDSVIYLAGWVERVDVVLDGCIGGLVRFVREQAFSAGLALHYFAVMRATEQAGSV